MQLRVTRSDPRLGCAGTRLDTVRDRMVFDEEGRMVNPTSRNYRIPAFADIPRTEVFFADTRDAVGPLWAKGMGECPLNPVAPAPANTLANTLADATGLSASAISRSRPVGSTALSRAPRGLMIGP
jgi:xanthine dehydrogenase molybdopterin-binding subunit B